MTRLIGIYTLPHRITVYKDGNCFQFVSFCFEARVIAGTPGLSDEVTDIGYFSRAEIATMKIIDPHQVRIEDAFARQVAAFIR